MTQKILLVEDEPHLAFNLQLNLKAEGYFVEHVANGTAALDAVEKKGPYDLILLDVMIPEPDGFAVAKAVRAHDSVTAIIMLTARAADKDRIRGLELGIDDYISKPFHLKELLLKVKRTMERSVLFTRDSQPTQSNLPKVYEFGAFALDTNDLSLRCPNGTFILTALEADVLSEFMNNPNRVLSREHLLSKVWNMQGNVETRTVDNFVMRLRKYLENDPANPTILESVRGRGYRFNIEGQTNE